MPRKTWCQINAKAGGTAEVLIYDVIGDWWMDTDAASIASRIKALDVNEITVRINSPGGSAFDGIAIMNALRAHDARVVVRVDGLAASAASVVAMAGDEIIMGPASQMMIHEAWVYTSGDAGFLRSEADRLDKLSESITALYARRAGGDFDEWRALVAAETWFTAEEAVSAGLADRVDGEPVEPGELSATFNLSRFRFAGREHAPAPRIPSAEAVEVNHKKGDNMSDLMKGLRERLGIAEGADEATVLAALDETLAERADPAPAGDLVAQLEARGLVAMDRTTLAENERRMTAGEQALAELNSMRCRTEVQSHVDRGAITPAMREHYESFLASDPDTARKLLAAMPSNNFPVEEIGHDADGVGGDGSGGDIRQSAAYKALEGF